MHQSLSDLKRPPPEERLRHLGRVFKSPSCRILLLLSLLNFKSRRFSLQIQAFRAEGTSPMSKPLDPEQGDEEYGEEPSAVQKRGVEEGPGFRVL